ncbi:ketoacyl-synt-domain-containing protein [Polyplosphaeria fusca]|uniref:Ketoacyl-synt-domain-containing protein n=1 Tax=Polyplosphaeria fusca TaxID=682080 RepID=A0A9P4V887_9PLEO|nr:ketoacyl-synt-domain-containing protein [Polyplosphaeria fusca]
MNGVHSPSPEPIAIVGMGCRLPGDVSSPSDLWELLMAERTGFREFGEDNINVNGFYHPDVQRPGSISDKGACLLNEDARLFDHAFFGVNSSIATTMDPSQRKMLEVSYEAFESAGEPWEKFSGSRVGVFVGNMNGDHNTMQKYGFDFPLAQASTGGSQAILSNRINHVFNLRGPSVTVDTACSSSLYALHIAVQSIRNGDCDGAIVGGCNLINAVETHALTVKLGILSPTSTCHTFDEAADGYCRAEGFGALYLKRYSDAVSGRYPIRALVRGTALNSNGRTAGISHPSVDGQEALIRQAYNNAALPTSQTGYVECHGTGTPIGDPIEVAAVGKVFGPERKQAPLLIGSVKTNLGHAEAASGVIAIMKTVLALEKGVIPATVGVQRLNPNIDFEGARAHVVTKATPWPDDLLRRASVNSFGYGGANGHCILDHESVMTQTCEKCQDMTNGTNKIGQEIPKTPGEYRNRLAEPAIQRLMLLPFSAHDIISLASYVETVRKFASTRSLVDIAYTLSARRSRFHKRDFRIINSSEPHNFLELQPRSQPKSSNAPTSQVGFVFTGQGAQWQGMGAQLFEYPVFRDSISRLDDTLRALSFAPPWSLEKILLGATDVNIHDAEVSQAVCTALQIAVVNLLQSWSITPEISVGHSSGEIAAAYTAGYISEAEAIATAYCRGRALTMSTQKGAMLVVALSVDACLQYLQDSAADVRIAAVNSPSSVTVSGDAAQIDSLHRRLQSADVFSRKLQTGGRAYHSHHMFEIGPWYEEFLELASLELAANPKLTESRRLKRGKWISSVVPDKTLSQETLKQGYWRQNLEAPVQFSRAVSRALESESNRPDVFIEIGPHSTLMSPLKEIFVEAESRTNTPSPTYLPAMKRFQDASLSLLQLCGELFVLNYPLDLTAVNSVEHGLVCTDMPRYRYNYGPPLYHENRVYRETRQRKYLRHDLLGARQAGCARNNPSWTNVLRPKDIPWLRHHKLLPDIVLPGSAYVALGIEALAQHLDINLERRQAQGCFMLRSVSLKNTMKIPDDDLGLEIMCNLQPSSASPNWYSFVISSVATDTDSWTEHASGSIQYANFSAPSMNRIDEGMEYRTIESEDWYNAFSAAGLGYGESFAGLSDIRSDPSRKVATASVKLDTTSHMFAGPESDYYIHPAALDMCSQLAIIAVHGGHAQNLRQGYIPIFIDELTVWPSKARETSAKAIVQADFKGLRGAHAKIQICNEAGESMVEVGNVRTVAYAGASGVTSSMAQSHPYTRLVWKPDISTLSHDDARKLFPPLNSPDTDGHATSYLQFERLLDLLAHRNPSMKILEVSAGNLETTAVTLKVLGGTARRYAKYVLASSQSSCISAAKSRFVASKDFSCLAIGSPDSTTSLDTDTDFDLIIASSVFQNQHDSAKALTRLRSILKPRGHILLMEPSNIVSHGESGNETPEMYSIFLPRPRWDKTLSSAGFSGIDIALDNYVPPYRTTEVVLATAVEPFLNGVTPAEKDQVHVISTNTQSGFHHLLEQQLSVAGLAPVSALLEECNVPEGARIILCVDIGYNSLLEGGEPVFSNLKRILSQSSSFLWLTDGDVLRGTNPQAAVVTGLIRMLTAEDSLSRYGVFHLEQGFDPEDADLARLVVEREGKLHVGDFEREIATHNGIAHISRLLQDNDLNDRYRSMYSKSPTIVNAPLIGSKPKIIDFAKPGVLSSLYFRVDDSFEQPLPDNWIEVKVGAVGLNWKDVAACSGRLDVQHYSLECAGTVTKCGSSVQGLSPGRRVYAFARGKFGTHVRIPAYHAQEMQSSDSFTAMATMPIAFCTAVYALKHLARLRRGERVLIQSATGGLGLAAMQIARSVGAEIFATAGTDQKMLHLQQECGLSSDRVFSSHGVADLSTTMQAVGNRGFDVILSSSNGEMMHETWNCLAPRGRFIDVGRVDVQRHRDMAMQVFSRNATFSSFDLSILADQDPDFISSLMGEVDELRRQGCISPIQPVTVFNASALDQALLSFSKGKHVGKLVVSYEDETQSVDTQLSVPRAAFDPGAVYVITGGNGGLGKSILQWMVERGARQLAILSRPRQPRADVLKAIQDYASRGVSVWVSPCDVTIKDQVRAALVDAATRGPIKGIIHAAAIFHDSLFNRLSQEQWKDGLAAKVQGSLNLHETSVEQELPLDHFIMTSSYEAVIALPTQPSYCAANNFQDAFARYRQSKGLPGHAIAFGLITEIGEVGQVSRTRDLIYRNGLYRTGELGFLRLLEGAFLEAPPRTGTSPQYDPLADAQITTCLEPSELAKMEGKNYDVETQIPRWHTDKKFSHILQSMRDELVAEVGERRAETVQPAVTAAVDKAVRSGAVESAVRIVVDAIAERAAALLAVPKETVNSQNSLAHYGVDSLISVEMRNWFAVLFDEDIPLMQLLDEALSIEALATIIVGKRKKLVGGIE